MLDTIVEFVFFAICPQLLLMLRLVLLALLQLCFQLQRTWLAIDPSVLGEPFGYASLVWH